MVGQDTWSETRPCGCVYRAGEGTTPVLVIECAQHSGKIFQARKKPLLVEAVRWDGKEATASIIAQWMGQKSLPARLPDSKGGYSGWAIEIVTHHGMVLADVGDYILKDVQGGFYPCKAKIFNDTYEKWP